MCKFVTRARILPIFAALTGNVTYLYKLINLLTDSKNTLRGDEFLSQAFEINEMDPRIYVSKLVDNEFNILSKNDVFPRNCIIYIKD